MTTITELAPGLTLISPKGKERERMITSLSVQLASAIIRSGLPLNDEDAIVLHLYDKGFPGPWIAHLFMPAMDLARRAMEVSDTYGLEISDREVIQ